MFRVRQLVLLFASVFAATAALAQQTTFQLDLAKSSVEFTLGDVLHTVHGKFRMKDSTVRFDRATGVASGTLIADATTGDTDNGARDKKMHKEVLESAKYPEFRFNVQTVRGNISANGTAQVEITGVMSIHGSDHPMTVTTPVTVSNGVASSDVHFEVPYVQWGIKDPSTFILRVAKKVDITVHAVGKLSPE